MTHDDKKFVATKAAIYEMGLLFNQSPSDDKIKAYAKALANYTPQQIKYAFKQVVNSGSAFFPSLAEILGHLKPKENASKDIGNFVANEIIQKVIDLGVYRLNEVYESLSEVSKKTLGENRYILTEIANSDRDQLTSIRAQIRDMASAAAESHKQGKRNEQLEKIGIKTGNILEFKTMDYSGYLDQGPA